MPPVRSRLALVCYALTFLIATFGVRPAGDGTEYLLAARALAHHGTPDLRVEDAEWLAQREPRWRKLAAELTQGIETEAPTSLAAVYRAPNGRHYSLHFWFFSLLAVPFLWLTELIGVPPVLALAWVNACGACAAIRMLFGRFARAGPALVATVLFLLFGTTFYLAWSGPEVLTGAAVLIACTAARRGQLGVGIAAGGLAATQNPSAVFVLPFVVWTAWRPRRPLPVAELSLVAAGVLLAALPYLFFFYEFRVWSRIARFAVDRELISWERAWSLVFDLNEGMIVGIPGLLVGSVAVVTLVATGAAVPERPALVRGVVATLVVVIAMAVPTFSIHNWNSGNVVFIRYAYWIAMPLFELALHLGERLAVRSQIQVAAVAAALQLAIVGLNGLWGERYNFVHHSWPAKLVLRYFPSAYNPVPEIFYERSLGWEWEPGKENVIVWPYRGEPGKVMVRYGYRAESPRICPDGSEILTDSLRLASDGWTYLDAPFRCRRP